MFASAFDVSYHRHATKVGSVASRFLGYLNTRSLAFAMRSLNSPATSSLS